MNGRLNTNTMVSSGYNISTSSLNKYTVECIFQLYTRSLNTSIFNKFTIVIFITIHHNTNIFKILQP